tara:strand:- start:158 stop:1108 length:951 start_codon:yes stop_codon:yes gene_type:complete
MISTINKIDTIPTTWIFENYCNLDEKLHGQDVKILSMFNSNDTIPSMFIYLFGVKYFFKDYSSGKTGDGIKLVSYLFNLNRKNAENKIITDYLSKKKDYEEKIPIKKIEKYKVTSFIKRPWNELDAKYWIQFNIGSSLLKKYNVFALSEYTMSKKINNELTEINIKNNYIYGYFKNDGTLYKVYQPYIKKKKFIKVKNYIQGTDQLLYNKPNLIITSSLKDIMSLDSLNFNAEFVSPDSENTLISKKIMSSYLLKYNNIFTLLDNDSAGHIGMNKYLNEYGIPSIFLNLSKDISDSIKDFNKTTVRNYINPLIPKK